MATTSFVTAEAALAAGTDVTVTIVMAATKKKPWKTGASSGHITNLNQSIFVFGYSMVLTFNLNYL